ncbi:DDB1- and CUL4-associated factor 5 [Phymastichus coffea]|uniref:DDB1- and CUL4-associated factor 5 n=1 Tax=Phymastichus coffea TaxID=108790 RepID=UPI00273C60CD|nr:DDB1- and CUL4-associated factor 5 [Phymastichus coffea]
MGDRSSRRRKAITTTTTSPLVTVGRGRSCCRRCGRKKRKLNMNTNKHNDHDQQLEMASSSVKLQTNPCNPINYIINRQTDSKVNYCHKLIDARFFNAQNLFRKDLYAHYGCINAIEFSKEGDLLVSGGDDKRVLLWKTAKAIRNHGKPVVMKAQHMSNIFCLGYNCCNSKIFSAGNDDQVIVHDLVTTDVLNFFRHEKPVYGLSPHPHNENVFSSACDDGRVLIYDIRGTASSAESFLCIAQHKSPFHAVQFNPADPKMLATANAKEGVSMWDVRKPLKPIIKYGPAQSCMNVKFSDDGATLLALRRRLPPVLYTVNKPNHLCQFDHPGYYNSCTMKSCCFAGTNSEYILSGSDDFNLYMWKIPTDKSVNWVDSAHMVLRGHRSIVNQVRYNSASCILASSGVEKIIKLWSPFQISQNCQGGLKREDDREEKQRRVYTHDEYIGLVLQSNQFMTHDYSHQSTDEDQRMMAFFDSLVQREIQNWSSEEVATPQSPSEPENYNASDRSEPSDSDDSTASDHQIMRCFLGSVNSHTTTNVPERPLESPNRITRLIANRREKLVRLATLGNGTHPKNNCTTLNTSAATNSNAPEAGSVSEPENNYTLRSGRCRSSKTALRSKGTKRKHSCLSKRNRARRKQNNAKDDSDSEPEEQPSQNHVVDAQPSTSTGVISSRRSRYASTPLVVEVRQRRSRSSSNSSNSSEDTHTKTTINGDVNKRRSVKTDSDSSSKEVQKRKITRKTKTSSMVVHSRRELRVKSKRQKVNAEESSNHNNNRNSSKESIHNGTSEDSLVTPSKNTRCPMNSDSGIASGMSADKSNVSTAEKSNSRGRTASPDRERTTKNCEWFKKKVDVARRGYRKRTMLPSPSSSSDSSDD